MSNFHNPSIVSPPARGGLGIAVETRQALRDGWQSLSPQSLKGRNLLSSRILIFSFSWTQNSDCYDAAPMRAFPATILLFPSFLLVCVFRAAQCSVHHYNGEKFFQTADAFLFRGGREGLFSSTPDAVAHWTTVGKGLANGKAYIR